MEGDIEFALSITSDKRVFFFVDNAGDHRLTVEASMRKLKELDKPAMFVLGSRLNEWRQTSSALLGTEYELQPLSDLEIERLIAYLERHGELGKLTDLSPEFRTAAIKNKHGKQLLVVMREATEGPGFDAIIEDEFRKIDSALSQRAYLAACAFYQHGAYLRDDLLARCLNVSLPELYRGIEGHTEGVILFDCLNEYHGTYGARARHRTIAEVVWLRCGGSSDKEKIWQDALVHLNLNFGPDKDAFDQFVRADVMVDSISTLDGKIRFFDTACRKQPDSPYVRQHYARMLAREGKFELALSQIEEGIKLNPRVRVLYHTKGKILTELTSATESTDLARRRLVQAEEAFRHGLQMLRSDEFCIQGLAELYLGWAKRCTASSEAADYIAKAEGTITEGLKVVRVRDGLRIVSSQIADWLGNRPDHVKALETAVKESPHSIIARYLLGRTYRRSGHPDRAVTVLEPLVKEHPEEFRACVELARSLVALKQPYSKAIAILHLSTLHGFSDPRFIATLGGMLFLNREFSEADKVFGESLKLGLASGEINRPEFRPRDNSDNSRPLRLNGKVASVKKGYAFIDAEEHPNVFCPGSRWGGIIMQRGVRVTFDIVFSAKGPQADNVTTL